MNNYLYYETPASEFQKHYNDFKFPFESQVITTLLPKNIAVIRSIATLALTGLVCFSLATPIFCWPIAIAGTAYAGWTIYSHLCSKDPLVEAFYKIAGGKDKFEQLPEIQLEQKTGEKLSVTIGNLKWNELEHSIAKAKTLDGRNILIVKGLTRYDQGTCNVKGTLAFVEKLGPYDVPRSMTHVHELVYSIMFAILPPLKANTFGRCLESSHFKLSHKSVSTECFVSSSISGQTANELAAQVALLQKTDASPTA